MCGMTDDQFWYGRPWAYAEHAEAHRREAEERSWERWQLGAYIYDALNRSAPVLNPFAEEHRSKPWPEAPYGMEHHLVDEDGNPVGESGCVASEEATHALIISQILNSEG